MLITINNIEYEVFYRKNPFYGIYDEDEFYIYAVYKDKQGCLEDLSEDEFAAIYQAAKEDYGILQES